ncbi:ATPase [Parasulfuritortus cantonensis]|uniref:ATPase n=1 Tax=Parasulfuritortus cantonensis TaxID=2528202 RepID=A0A4R1BKW9_9PROT|nr:ATPase [Parasulfuritortus cantonensis]TCJ17994.1 ATPase [Parasulfuritortus cantonensis]
MEDVLKRLLDTETRAEAIITAAEAERKRLIDAAMEEARGNEARFQAETAGRRQPIMQEAEDRAGQLVADLTRKFEARQRALREQADRNETEAIAAALATLLDPEA